MIDALESATDAIRGTKEHAVKTGQGDLLPTIVAYRGDQMVALIQGSAIDRDQMLNLVYIAASGYEADVVATAFETWIAHNLAENPLTGRPWVPGDMQDLVENHDGRAKGWIVDALMISAVNRAGDFRARTVPYRTKGRRVEWIEGGTQPDEVAFEGYIADQMRQTMLAPPMMSTQEMAKGSAIFGITDHEQMWGNRDCAISKLILDPPAKWLAQGFPEGVVVALGMAPGSKREQIIRESMPYGRRIRWED